MTMRTEGRIWYVSALAFVFLSFCTIGCIYYVSLHLRQNAPTVSTVKQLLCLGMAVAAGSYFFRARFGHMAMIFLTILTLLAIGITDVKASGFNLCVLLVLLMPFLIRKTT
jgi:hypothetical protein